MQLFTPATVPSPGTTAARTAGTASTAGPADSRTGRGPRHEKSSREHEPVTHSDREPWVMSRVEGHCWSLSHTFAHVVTLRLSLHPLPGSASLGRRRLHKPQGRLRLAEASFSTSIPAPLPTLGALLNNARHHLDEHCCCLPLLAPPLAVTTLTAVLEFQHIRYYFFTATIALARARTPSTCLALPRRRFPI